MSETSPGGTTQQFTWNTLSSVPQLLMDGSNAYIYGPQTSSLGNAPVEQISLSAPNSQSSASYLLSDPEGVRLTFNSSGTITAYASYDAYGNVISGGLSSVTPFGYAGGYTDPTGLIYLVNRYYDPSTGQFLSVDPLVGVTDQPYQYVGGDPVNGSDPLGLCNIFGNCWSEAAHAVTHVAHDVGHFVQHHWRGIAQAAIATTAVVVSVASLGTLSGAALILASATIGAFSAQASYYAGCVGTKSGCSVTGALTATITGGITSGVSAGLGEALCESSVCLSAIGMATGTAVGSAGYFVDSALEHTCLTGAEVAGAGADGLDAVSLNQNDWGRLWSIIKHAFASGSGGEE